jgi:hypothetical protein
MIDLTENPVDYLALPKAIGEVNPEDLLNIAEYYQSLGYESLSHFMRAKYKMIAASALIEAMLLYPDSGHEDDDYRLTNIDLAEEMLKSAAGDQLEILEQGFTDPNDKIAWLRTTIATDFMDVYRDMICGEMSDLTIKTLRETLHNRLHELTKLGSVRGVKNSFKADLHGLQSELTVIADVWHKYTEPDDPIVIPSTYRGGNGEQREEETHDLVFLMQNEDTTFGVIKTGEVKSEGAPIERHLRHLGRYACSLIMVSRDGRIRTIE